MKDRASNIAVTISTGPLTAAVPIAAEPGGGAMVCFEGVVRRLENEQTIGGLHYQAYQPMAERQLRLIAEELVSSFGLLQLSVEHGVGWIPVGECSLRLVVVAPHRKEAFVAMQEFIDRLKRDVPIWKSVQKPLPGARAVTGLPAAAEAPAAAAIPGAAGVPAAEEPPADAPNAEAEISPGRIHPKRFDAVSDSPIDIVLRLAEQCAIVTSESVAIAQSSGRILAERIVADRDHPACDISAVDGYAIRLNQIERRRLPIAFTLRIGQPVPAMPEAGVVKIVTGGAVPIGAEAMIRRELVEEYPDGIVIPESIVVRIGQDIRRRGDNTRAGDLILDAGVAVTPAVMSALASFGVAQPLVRRKVRVAVIVGGDELVDMEQSPEPWEIRESNGHALHAFLSPIPWIDVKIRMRVADDLAALVAALEESLRACDVVLLSGGVSLGDRDFVPAAIQAARGRVIYHGLPVRPGRPMLGAVGPGGQAILGLPGNPLSVMTAVRRFAMIVLRRIGALTLIDPPVPVVHLASPIAADAQFWLFRPVRLTETGVAAPLSVKSSGDLVAAAKSDGFVQIAPGSTATTAPFFRWSFS